jgi:hypothetical protein
MLDKGILSVLLLFELSYVVPRNQRKSGRSVTRLPAVIPSPASTFDQMEIWVVASEDSWLVSICCCSGKFTQFQLTEEVRIFVIMKERNADYNGSAGTSWRG